MASAQTRSTGSEHSVDDDCIRLTSYFGERQRTGRAPFAEGLMELYASQQIEASIVLRGIEGSATAIAVGTRPEIEALVGRATDLTGPGLVTMEQARLLTGDIDPVWLGERPGEATRLTVYSGHHDRVYQVPAFEAVCELLYRRCIAGATVLAGVDGTARGHRQRNHFPRRETGAPLVITAVGSGNEI
jgi:PII-like signaling protein